MEFSFTLWSSFIVFIVIALTVDLGILNRKPKDMSFKEALLMSMGWVSLAGLFCAFIWHQAGDQKALEFVTGYIVELSLSADNVFIFVLLFSFFNIPLKYQHRVLFWGILGAVIMRLFMITTGIYLINAFEWIFYIFGAFLVYSGIHIAMSREEDHKIDPEDNMIMKFLRRYLRVTDELHNEKFWVRHNGKMVATPLFVVLVLIEKTDLIFALDSIPAIIAITRDPFIVFTSNIFAILGLRSLYFLLASVIHKFVYLKYGISVILSYVGVKMILSVQGIHIPTEYSLALILTILSLSIISSLLFIKKQKA